MENLPNLPNRRYSVIYADPPWAYRQCGATAKSRGNAAKHYQTMDTASICALPVSTICAEGAACFMWATFPNIGEAIKVLEVLIICNMSVVLSGLLACRGVDFFCGVWYAEGGTW